MSKNPLVDHMEGLFISCIIASSLFISLWHNGKELHYFYLHFGYSLS